MDGGELSNVENIYMYRNYDEPDKSRIEITMKHENKDEDIVVFTNVTASETEGVVHKDVNQYNNRPNEQIIVGAFKLCGKIPPKK